MGRIKPPALFGTPAPVAKRYKDAGIAEANAHFTVDFSKTCLDKGRQKAKNGIGTQAAGRSHRMEEWRSSGKGGSEPWGLEMAAIWTEAKARHCGIVGTRPVGEVLVDAFWNMTLWALDRCCLF